MSTLIILATLIRIIIVAEKIIYSSSIKHCGLLRTWEDLYVHVGAGSGIEFGNDTESVGKSAGNWLSTIGEESISVYRDPFWFDVSPAVENQQLPIA